MDAAAKQLEQLNQKIADATAMAEGAQEAWLSERDPQQGAKLEKVWQQLLKDKELILKEGRNARSAQLTSKGNDDFKAELKAEVLALVARPPFVTTTMLQELGQRVKKQARVELPLPSPAAGLTWNDPLWAQVAAPESHLREAGEQGLQSKFCRLLNSAPSSMSFEFHDVHTAPSVCGNDLKPDTVMSLRGIPVCPLTTGAIINLKRQDGAYDNDKNVGQAVTYGRTFLQQLPRGLRHTVYVALTDLQRITLMRVTLPANGQLKVDMSTQLADVKSILLQLLSCQPASLRVQLPDLGPSLKITGLLGHGATSHVFQGTTSNGDEVAIKVPLARTLDHELEMLLTLRGLRGVPSLAIDTLVQGAIVSTPVLQPLTLAVIWRARLHLAVPALVSTFKDAHNLGLVNRDVRLSNLMTDTAASVLWPIDWGCATRQQQAPFEGTVHYASKAILDQLILEQWLQFGQHASVLARPADDLESLVCTAFCVTHPDMQVELEKLARHQLADILSWWQHTAWASRPAWTEALQAARAQDYTSVGVRLQRLLE